MVSLPMPELPSKPWHAFVSMCRQRPPCTCLPTTPRLHIAWHLGKQFRLLKINDILLSAFGAWQRKRCGSEKLKLGNGHWPFPNFSFSEPHLFLCQASHAVARMIQSSSNE